MSPNDLILAAKLGYEWKNIYRMLSAKNQKAENEEHIIEVSEFDKVCQHYKVHLSNEEINKMVKQHGITQINVLDKNEAEIIVEEEDQILSGP